MTLVEHLPKPAWRIAIDTGGTFTDALAVDPKGVLTRAKVLSSAALRGRAGAQPSPDTLEVRVPQFTMSPGLLKGFHLKVPGSDSSAEVLEHLPDNRVRLDRAMEFDEGSPIELSAPFDAPRLAIYLLLGCTPDTPIDDIEVRVATTRGTNALLEGTGDPFALILDSGLEDLLQIGDQTREDIFALNIKQSRLHPTDVFGVAGRLAKNGEPIDTLTPEQLDRLDTQLKGCEADALGIALAHSWRAPNRETELAAALQERGYKSVICSTELSRAQGLLPRTETLAVEVTLRRILDSFVDDILPQTNETKQRLSVMTSAGGLSTREDFFAKDGLLSGPAGGVVGAANAGRADGVDQILVFDMGGTSTDVSRYDQEFIYRFETRLGPARIQAPCLAIESVAAGGGSICHISDDGMAVGPKSASADPGPASYCAGGPLTITDVNLLLGRGDPNQFGIPIELQHAENALSSLREDLRAFGHTDPGREAVLHGLLDIANERMAEAMRSISIREGADPTQHTLVPFGGAGGQHACAIAERLGVTKILIPQDAGLLSALGVLQAKEERFAEVTVLQPLQTALTILPEMAQRLESDALARLNRSNGVITRRILALRLVGQDAVIQIEYTPGEDPTQEFDRAFTQLYGYPPPQRDIEIAWMRIVAAEHVDEIDAPSGNTSSTQSAAPSGQLMMSTRSGMREVPMYLRSALSPGDLMIGPAIIHEGGATTVLDDGWQGAVTSSGALMLEPCTDSASTTHLHGAEGAAAAELVAARLTAIATGMGQLLERTALSVNVKERLDFSCAILDETGRLLVNAPHMPIHLGSMGICVRRTLELLDANPGDVLVTNHPGCGGSHLPDVTTIAPIYERGTNGRRLAFVAVRAHHAEIGGTRPGSTPPFATTLLEEGVLIPPVKVLEAGEPQLDLIEAFLQDARWPSRRPLENIADLQAQIASTRHGVQRITELATALGADRYLELAQSVHANATKAARRAIQRLGSFERIAQQRLDDGALINLNVKSDGERLTLDFTGSSEAHPLNFNAPIAIATGAAVYLMRLLADREVPMNEGLLEPVDLIVPEGMLNPTFSGDPAIDPAVCAGNTETSQRIVDTLLQPFGLAASSQGTMNNFLFGTDAFGYYETIAGGSGATADAAGCSGVHTHMTNTRITDPEILEDRYPVRLECFQIRNGSGGAGLHPGGNGLIRSVRALEAIDVSLVAQHRIEEPYGLNGGQPGARGCAYIMRSDGSREDLGGSAECSLGTGDTLTIETPGGGGWGPCETS